MAKRPRLSVFGGKETQQALSEALNKLEKGLEGATHAAAEPVTEEAKRRAPKRTRNLAEHIEQETLEKEPGRVVVGVGPDNEEAFYGRFVELGTSEHQVGPDQARALLTESNEFAAGARPAGARAQPYLRPALDNNRKAIEKGLIQNIGKLLGL